MRPTGDPRLQAARAAPRPSCPGRPSARGRVHGGAGDRAAGAGTEFPSSAGARRLGGFSRQTSGAKGAPGRHSAGRGGEGAPRPGHRGAHPEAPAPSVLLVVSSSRERGEEQGRGRLAQAPLGVQTGHGLPPLLPAPSPTSRRHPWALLLALPGSPGPRVSPCTGRCSPGILTHPNLGPLTQPVKFLSQARAKGPHIQGLDRRGPSSPAT